MTSRAGGCRLPYVLVGAALLLLHAQPGAAQVSREYEIKAAFVYNFIRFVEWPTGAFAEPGSPIAICVLGRDPFGPALDALADKTVLGRPLAIKRLERFAPGGSCHVLFISSSEAERLSTIIEALARSTTLTIGEMAGFAQKGGIINLVLENNRVRFEINPDVAERSGLTISSRLLNLARVVRAEPTG